MSPFWQDISNAEQRAQDYAEAAVLLRAASYIRANATTWQAALGAAAPQGVADAVAAIEKADANVPESAFVNFVLTSGESQIDAELKPIIAQGGLFFNNVAAAVEATAQKLQAKAATL